MAIGFPAKSCLSNADQLFLWRDIVHFQGSEHVDGKTPEETPQALLAALRDRCGFRGMIEHPGNARVPATSLMSRAIGT